MPSPFGRTIKSSYHAILDLLFPPRCVVCHRTGEWFCTPCQDLIQMVQPPWCERCGQPLDADQCPHCHVSPLQIDGLRAVAFFEGALREAIHAFKFRHRVELAPIFGMMLYRHVSQWAPPFNVIMPVPLHRTREQVRGYNQALLLAQELAVHEKLPMWYNRVERTRATRPQTELDARSRRENVRGAFAVTGPVGGARVLLIDDVCTTGATMEACSVALKRCGADSVWGLALARGR